MEVLLPPGLVQKRPKSNPQKKKIQNPSFRPGDWICAVCQNLNFSFRKDCNRCKLQTKEKNEEILKPSSLKLMSKKQKIEISEKNISNEKILSKKNSVDSNSTKCSVSSNLKQQFEAVAQLCRFYNESSKDPTPSVSPLLRKIRSHNASFEDLDLIEIQEESFVVKEPVLLDLEQNKIFECFPVNLDKKGVAKSVNLEENLKNKGKKIFIRRSYCYSGHQDNSQQSESGKSFKELQKSIERQNEMNEMEKMKI